MWSTWPYTLGKMRSKPSYFCIRISKVFICFSKPFCFLVVVFFLEQCSFLLMHAQVSLHLILVPRVCVYLDILHTDCCRENSLAMHQTPTERQNTRSQAVWHMPDWLLVLVGSFPGTKTLDLTNFGPWDLSLKANDSWPSQYRQKNCRGDTHQGTFPLVAQSLS